MKFIPENSWMYKSEVSWKSVESSVADYKAIQYYHSVYLWLIVHNYCLDMDIFLHSSPDIPQDLLLAEHTGEA